MKPDQTTTDEPTGEGHDYITQLVFVKPPTYPRMIATVIGVGLKNAALLMLAGFAYLGVRAWLNAEQTLPDVRITSIAVFAAIVAGLCMVAAGMDAATDIRHWRKADRSNPEESS